MTAPGQLGWSKPVCLRQKDHLRDSVTAVETERAGAHRMTMITKVKKRKTVIPQRLSVMMERVDAQKTHHQIRVMVLPKEPVHQNKFAIMTECAGLRVLGQLGRITSVCRQQKDHLQDSVNAVEMARAGAHQMMIITKAKKRKTVIPQLLSAIMVSVDAQKTNHQIQRVMVQPKEPVHRNKFAIMTDCAGLKVKT